MKIDTYKTKDLAESAALVLEGQLLKHIARDGNICWFVFEDKEKCQEISDKFFFKGLLVDARHYKETIDLLKNRIFSRT